MHAGLRRRNVSAAALPRALALAVLVACAAGPGAAGASVVRPPVRAPARLEPVRAPLVGLTPASALGLGSAYWRKDHLYAAGGPGRALGAGEFGVVFQHPSDEALAVKVMADRKDSMYRSLAGYRSRRQLFEDAQEEARTSALLAEAGAGPKLVGLTQLPDRLPLLFERLARALRAPQRWRPAVIKERVDGDRMDWRKRRGDWTEQDEELFQELQARLDRAGLVARDLEGDNVMIGTTAADPVRRAYLIDGGLVYRRAE